MPAQPRAFFPQAGSAGSVLEKLVAHDELCVCGRRRHSPHHLERFLGCKLDVDEGRLQQATCGDLALIVLNHFFWACSQ
jgi:hypothetical protein